MASTGPFISNSLLGAGVGGLDNEVLEQHPL